MSWVKCVEQMVITSSEYHLSSGWNTELDPELVRWYLGHWNSTVTTAGTENRFGECDEGVAFVEEEGILAADEASSNVPIYFIARFANGLFWISCSNLSLVSIAYKVLKNEI